MKVDSERCINRSEYVSKPHTEMKHSESIIYLQDTPGPIVIARRTRILGYFRRLVSKSPLIASSPQPLVRVMIYCGQSTDGLTAHWAVTDPFPQLIGNCIDSVSLKLSSKCSFIEITWISLNHHNIFFRELNILFVYIQVSSKLRLLLM